MINLTIFNDNLFLCLKQGTTHRVTWQLNNARINWLFSLAIIGEQIFRDNKNRIWTHCKTSKLFKMFKIIDYSIRRIVTVI